MLVGDASRAGDRGWGSPFTHTSAPRDPGRAWQELRVRAAGAGRAAMSEQAEAHVQVMGEQ